MYAIELNAVINNNHEIYLKLPDTVQAKTAKVIIMYEENEYPNQETIAAIEAVERGEIEMTSLEELRQLANV